MLVYAKDGSELQFPVASKDLQVGDLVLLEKGQYIPADTKILVGDILAKDEEGNEQRFEPKSIAIGGWLILEGTAKGYVSSMDN